MKKKLFLALGLAILLCSGNVAVHAQKAANNGVSYVLLGNEFNFDEDALRPDLGGVYRLNSYENSSELAAEPYLLFNLVEIKGKVGGIAANQKSEIFLLASPKEGAWEDAEVGWLPNGMSFDADSPIYLECMLPDDPEGGVSGYKRSGTPHWADATKSGKYWQLNYSILGKTYKYAVVFGGPDEVKYLNCEDGTEGTPIWPGTFSPTTGLPHPDNPRKVILPSHWAGVAYYAYGSSDYKEFPCEALDGTIGRSGAKKPKVIWSEAQAGHQEAPYSTDYFACIVKRVYKKREKALDLYLALDAAPPPPAIKPQMESAGMLSSMDVTVTEAYGKYCGDNCIPGGTLGSSTVTTQLSTVRVVTSTKGARYGFNPQGTRKTADINDINAALRVVRPGSKKTEAISISVDENATKFAPIVKNATYLATKEITPANLTSIGVSSDFSNTNGLDFVYGSNADKFVVQDSWWGRGGIAYEYFAETGMIKKLDYIYMISDMPAIEELGVIEGKIDDIGIDGDGYLYVMRTEKIPSDDVMLTKDVNINAPGADPKLFFSVTSWLRPPVIEGPTSKPTEISEGSQIPGDYKVITLKQEIYKAIKRYPQATNSLGAEEDRGRVFAGYDLWTRAFEVKTSGNVDWKHLNWQPEATRLSDYPGELAVVNLAKVPEDNPGSEVLNIIAIGDVDAEDGSELKPNKEYTQGDLTKSVKEHSSMSFKIEGYKPYINEEPQGLKPIGDILTPAGVLVHKNVMLNAIPNDIDGRYVHDENGDELFSGFPSSMFEAEGKPTTVKWKVYLVENNDLSGPIQKIESYPEESGTGDLNAFNFKFPHPGNYVIQAEVIYHKFDLEGIDNSVRPHELKYSTRNVTTAPFLVKVYSENLKLNESPSYISNIQLKPLSRTYLHGVANSTENGVGPLFSLIDFEEDKELGGIEICFDAQFVRDRNRNIDDKNNPLETYDGIGVWDYRYYARLYNEIPNYFPGLPYSAPDTVKNLSDEAQTSHVYNYDPAGDPLTINSKIRTNVYNPGRPKDDKVGAEHGTMVGNDINGNVVPPNETDWSFIQWGLYLQPSGPYKLATPTSDLGSGNQRHARGILIASGSCNAPDVDKQHISNRKYSVKIPVEAAKFNEIIHTPKDPETFSLHVEILYPRVSWMSNDLEDKNTEEKRFSSIVPLNDEDGNKPFHILSRMLLAPSEGAEPSNNFLINQSWKDSDNKDFFVDGQENIGVLARDFTLPKFVEEPGTNETPIIQTTGDQATDVKVSFAVYDNNPHAEIGKFYPAYEMVRINPNSGQPDRKFDSSESNKVFKEGPEITNIAECKGPDDVNFFRNNSWEAGASFTTLLTDYGPNSVFDSGNTFENWIGELNYTVLGSIKDGIGSYATIIEHQFYHEKACTDLGKTIKEEAKIPLDDALVKAVVRRDNDPPSIEVELISQVDNRRWEFKLTENIKDLCRFPQAPADLADCTLEATCYNLQNGSVVSALSDDKIPGCTAFPNDMGETDVNALTRLPTALPEFRRASRLLVNVRIFDNTGFRDLKEASIAIVNLDGGTTSLLPSNSPAIPLRGWQDINGNKLDTHNRPHASYAIDMPMKALPDQNQVMIELYASDADGNRRKLIIPVKVVESTFETRVLEIKENRK